MELADCSGPPGTALELDPVLRAFEDGVAAIGRIGAALGVSEDWAARTPCPEWRARDLAAHLRCIADDYHEYLDDAPASRYARLLGSGPHPQALARKLARQNAAELAALPDAPPEENLAAFAASARAYARRLPSVWYLPHHQYRDVVVAVAGMAGAATAEWHLHAWDLARALGTEHRPADPEAVLAGWRTGMTHLPATIPGSVPGRPAPRRPGARWPAAATVASAAGPVPVPSYAVPRRSHRGDDPWHILLRASGRQPP